MNVNLRDIPDDMHQKIKELAKKEKRSWNSQALILLELALKADTKSAQNGRVKP